MAPAFDSLLMFRTTGNLTQSESNGPLTIRGTGIMGMAARVVIPLYNVTFTASLGIPITPRYWGSNDNVTYTLFAVHPGGPQQVPAGRSLELITPIVTNFKYVIEELVLGSTTPGLGAVQSGLVTGVGYDWSRAVDWS